MTVLKKGGIYTFISPRVRSDPLWSLGPDVTRVRISLGNRFKPTNRFGLFGFKKFRFPSYGNQSVCERTKNQRIRFWFVWLGFLV